MMDIQALINSLKKTSKKDPIPGTTEGEVQECPACENKTLYSYKKCCGNPNGYLGCRCGYKVQL